jgi:hypothetical protein
MLGLHYFSRYHKQVKRSLDYVREVGNDSVVPISLFDTGEGESVCAADGGLGCRVGSVVLSRIPGDYCGSVDCEEAETASELF